ncbi:two-component sensor histidine kinase [Gordonia pseudamarae]|uniref:histidine kinase n=1 Tax=Gordonia pseudamarae TaxID=2831662 RepID=A0ABX6IJP6_9ACTN|nr:MULTISPECIES: histidine kinase [Gordonia]MBD0023083.1 two-component sensor histidine kinase [Gordonia sp. (in: high G+C Gram-positive bacteria)]QHN27216.1 two-component sensor histidine kinase [Gordonia pseudamarae]QHN36099.1 two-component sensor histidine kinase [Gordonia pseudamarae]
MRPEDYQPVLTARSHAWRLALMLLVSAIGFADQGRAAYLWEHVRWQFVADLALGAASFVAVGWRRSHPVAVNTVINVASTVSATCAGPACLALVSLSTRRRWVEIIPQALLGLMMTVVAQQFFGTPRPESQAVQYGAATMVTAALVAWGMYIGSRRELLAELRARTVLAEAERDAEVARARTLERTRIAREMHDIVAHRISAISMHAGALAFRTDLPPGAMRETAQTIRDTANLALHELREVLGVLRDDPGDAHPEQPQSGAFDIDELIADGVRDGTRVTYTRSMELAELPEPLLRTLYRCLQEALTNARKHAPGVLVSVRLKDSGSGGVDLLVDNPLPLTAPAGVPASGLGLVGLAERVALAGGRYSATLTDDRRFVLHVWLPWTS